MFRVGAGACGGRCRYMVESRLGISLTHQVGVSAGSFEEVFP